MVVMGAADQLLAKAGEQAERALAADDESAAIAAAAAAARLALRGILADRGKPTPDDVSPDTIASLLADAGLHPPQGVEALAGLADPPPRDRADALQAAGAAVTWAGTSLM